MLKHLTEGGIARAMRHTMFRRFALGDFASLLGNWVQRVAVGWLTWQLTESGTWLGIIAIAEVAPSVLLSPLGGAYADKGNRLRISIVTQVMSMGQAVCLAALTLGGVIEVWSLVALTMARGCFNAWSHPARHSLVPSLVPQSDIPTAIALNSVFFNLSRFIGPALAGVIIAKWGIGHAFVFNTVTFLIFLLVLITLKVPPQAVTGRRHRSIFGQVADGYRYVAGHPGIGPLMLLLLATALFARPVADLLPGFAGAVFERGATGLAWMTSAMGLGSMVGAFGIAQRGHVRGLTRFAVSNTAVMALALMVFAAVPVFWPALALLAVASFAMTVTSISCQSLVQHAVDDELRGRVVSIYGVIFRAGPAAGALIIGALSEVFGWHWPLAVSAALCLAAWLWGRKRLNGMREALEA